MLGLRFCARAFSSCGERGPLFIAVHGPLTIAASLVAEHRLQTRRLSSCGSRAQLLCGMWDLPRPGLEPLSPALAGRFSTTAPPGKPSTFLFFPALLPSRFLPLQIAAASSSLPPRSTGMCLSVTGWEPLLLKNSWRDPEYEWLSFSLFLQEENERTSCEITLQHVLFGALNHTGENKNKIKQNRADKLAKTNWERRLGPSGLSLRGQDQVRPGGFPLKRGASWRDCGLQRSSHPLTGLEEGIFTFSIRFFYLLQIT